MTWLAAGSIRTCCTSFGAFLTICRITRNDAEARIRAIAAKGWQSSRTGTVTVKVPQGKPAHEAEEVDDIPTEDGGTVDLEQWRATASPG